MFFGLCIVINMRNKNQHDALFTFKLFLQLTSTCFEQFYSSSSGGIFCIYGGWYMSCVYVGWLLAGSVWNATGCEGFTV